MEITGTLLCRAASTQIKTKHKRAGTFARGIIPNDGRCEQRVLPLCLSALLLIPLKIIAIRPFSSFFATGSSIAYEYPLFILFLSPQVPIIIRIFSYLQYNPHILKQHCHWEQIYSPCHAPYRCTAPFPSPSTFCGG